MTTVSAIRPAPEAAVSRAVIKAVLHLILNTRTPNKDSKWRASCQWDGRTFEAVSRNGAAYALCRKLLEARCPDQAMEVWASRYIGGGEVEVMPKSPSLRFAFIHAAAARTIEENAQTPIRTRTYRAPGIDAGGVPAAQRGANSPPEVPEEGSGKLRVYGESGTAA